MMINIIIYKAIPIITLKYFTETFATFHVQNIILEPGKLIPDMPPNSFTQIFQKKKQESHCSCPQTWKMSFEFHWDIVAIMKNLSQCYHLWKLVIQLLVDTRLENPFLGILVTRHVNIFEAQAKHTITSAVIIKSRSNLGASLHPQRKV